MDSTNTPWLAFLARKLSSRAVGMASAPGRAWMAGLRQYLSLADYPKTNLKERTGEIGILLFMLSLLSKSDHASRCRRQLFIQKFGRTALAFPREGRHPIWCLYTGIIYEESHRVSTRKNVSMSTILLIPGVSGWRFIPPLTPRVWLSWQASQLPCRAQDMVSAPARVWMAAKRLHIWIMMLQVYIYQKIHLNFLKKCLCGGGKGAMMGNLQWCLLCANAVFPICYCREVFLFQE